MKPQKKDKKITNDKNLAKGKASNKDKARIEGEESKFKDENPEEKGK